MPGIHHVTAIAGNPSRNVEFYTRTLGLRLVKKTVNFDDPGTYHLYYGDEEGRPGTILTFFPWEHAASGRNGDGLAEETAFRIPAQSMGYWTHRLIEKGVPHNALEKRRFFRTGVERRRLSCRTRNQGLSRRHPDA
jgi:glyoxalase family protein